MEYASGCCTSADRDIKTVTARSEHEGISFLTITLPTLGKELEVALDQGRFDRYQASAFKRQGGLPAFLGGFLDRVFSRSSGALLENPCVDSIRAIRQLTLMFGKISLPCSDARVRKAMRGYVECEHDVVVHDSTLGGANYLDFLRIAGLLFDRTLSEVDHKVFHGEVRPKHGPGSTADRLRGNAKYRQWEWPERLSEEFSHRDFLVPDRSYDLWDLDIVEPGRERPVRIVPVPKTLKTPRIIAIEPTAMMYVQQGLYELILESLQRNKTLSRMIGFDDQTPNQRMAQEGSREGTLATLDLSEASDRVSNQHVLGLLASAPSLSDGVQACRSTKADVPGEGVIPLSKFASMGSALTFPLEAMVFTTLIFLGIERELRAPLCWRDVKHFSSTVRVYGDDIIIPVEYVQSVIRALEDFGLKVNESKSFWDGKFRESCGREYYDGEDVSIVRVREVFPVSRKDAIGVISLVSLRNQLYLAGMWQTVRWLDERIRELIHYFPTVLPSSPIQGRHSFLGYQYETLCKDLQSPLIKGFVVSPKIPLDPLDGMGALTKFYLKRGDSPSHSEDHLERFGRASDVRIKLRLASPV